MYRCTDGASWKTRLSPVVRATMTGDFGSVGQGARFISCYTLQSAPVVSSWPTNLTLPSTFPSATTTPVFPLILLASSNALVPAFPAKSCQQVAPTSRIRLATLVPKTNLSRSGKSCSRRTVFVDVLEVLHNELVTPLVRWHGGNYVSSYNRKDRIVPPEEKK